MTIPRQYMKPAKDYGKYFLPASLLSRSQPSGLTPHFLPSSARNKHFVLIFHKGHSVLTLKPNQDLNSLKAVSKV